MSRNPKININSLSIATPKMILDSGWYLEAGETTTLDKMFDLLEVSKNYRNCMSSKKCLYAPDLLLSKKRKMEVFIVQFQYDTAQYTLDASMRQRDLIGYVKTRDNKNSF